MDLTFETPQLNKIQFLEQLWLVDWCIKNVVVAAGSKKPAFLFMAIFLQY